VNKKFVNFIVKKYLKFDKTQPFISISFILAFLGIMTGVGVLIIAMSIMNGMDKEFERKLTIMNYPLTIFAKFDGAITNEFLNNLEKKISFSSIFSLYPNKCNFKKKSNGWCYFIWSRF
jgi:putative ABC transport system permease protein